MSLQSRQPATVDAAQPAEGVPWHAVVLIVAGLALLIAVEITLAFAIAKLVTGRAYTSRGRAAVSSPQVRLRKTASRT